MFNCSRRRFGFFRNRFLCKQHFSVALGVFSHYIVQALHRSPTSRELVGLQGNENGYEIGNGGLSRGIKKMGLYPTVRQTHPYLEAHNDINFQSVSRGAQGNLVIPVVASSMVGCIKRANVRAYDHVYSLYAVNIYALRNLSACQAMFLYRKFGAPSQVK